MSEASPASPRAQPNRKVQVSCTPGFLEWLEAERISVAFTTYQTNRLFLIGRADGGRLAAFERLLDRPMGLAASAHRLWVATRFQLWRFDQVLEPGERHAKHDRLYVPRVGRVTGEVDAHDVHFTGDGDVVFVNTLYSCLARPSDRHSFEVLWTPPWISELAPEDRCHLNGLAMEGGRPRYVTAVARTDERQGWREHRTGGGILAGVDSGAIVASGLSMPHSPRVHDGEVYLCNSGTGELGRVDTSTGSFKALAFCPGYLRGLAIRGRRALVGLSKPREKTFRGLPLDGRLADAQLDPRCALQVIDLDTGECLHQLEIHSVVSELYDVAILPETVHPMALGFKSDELRRTITFEEGDRVTRHVLHRLEPGPAVPGGAPLPRNREDPGAGPAALAEPSGAAESSPPPLPRELAARTLEVTLAQALEHADITFPDLQRTAVSRPLHEPLLATLLTAADAGNAPLAAAVTNLRPGGRTAEIVSLVVRSDARGRGLGKLLLASVEADLARRGMAGVDLAFQDGWSHVDALRALLAGRGWNTPKTEVILARTDERFLKQAWVRERPLPEGYEIFPWTDLSPRERREIVRRQQREQWFPEALSPFQMENRIAEEVSVGLRHRGRVVGWLVAHHATGEVLQYTSLFVEPGHGKLGRGLPLVAAAARRQIEDTEIPRGIFMVQADNTRMLRLLDRRLAPFLAGRSELLRSGKRLVPSG